MTETIFHSTDQQDFLRRTAEKRAGVLQWAPGIEFVCRKESLGWGLALNIRRQAQRPELFSETLKRRFEDVESYEGYYICLDSQRTFVVWHELQGDYRCEQIQALLLQLLSLAGLKH
ncbi:negative regulator of hrp expression HrpV [Pseudomonas vanderleydeniana]|uniref:Negative regulator of hrp expression HrpV n=1 Tax=Pseudomonas vanderleydeniana TaxID=2745495 RepID=A0A9E6PSA5_9PSED|nr:negative regulator of hrp expression HrpV [Pseudomonas vanderleydeniana]QXI31253.1 negative regulator of hrp expression HrpV [Pseudomonas vanderleydeniana]